MYGPKEGEYWVPCKKKRYKNIKSVSNITIRVYYSHILH